MRAAILNGLPQALNAGPGMAGEVVEIPGGVVVTGPPVAAPRGFDIERAKEWWTSGQTLAAAGGDPGSSFDFGAALGAAAAGAAAGVAIAGVGAVLGAIVAVGAYAIKWITGRNNPSQWDNAGPGVHWWFTNYAPQAYLDYLVANNATGVFASVKDSARGLIVYWLTIENYVLWPDHKHYANRFDMDYAWDATGFEGEAKNAWVRQLYADLGVEWDATVDLWNADGQTSTIMMKNRVVVMDEEPTATDTDTAETSGTGLAVVAGLGLLAIFAANRH